MKINSFVIEDILKEHLGKILDIGCGEGKILDCLDKCGYKIYGLDKEKKKSPFSFKKFDLNSMKKLPYKDKTFDYVVCTEVLGYLDNPVFLIKEIYRILKEEGILFLTTPNPENIYSKYLYLFKNRFMHFFDDIKNAQTHPLLLKCLEHYLYKEGFVIPQIRNKFFSKDSLYIKAIKRKKIIIKWKKF